MNKSFYKSFAINARTELIERVKQKAFEIGITEDKVKKAQIEASDAIYINGRPLDKVQVKQRNSLIERIDSKGYMFVMEEVAYTWFNRFCALRYMEVNDYLPTGVRVLSSVIPGSVEPDILRQALTVDLDLDQQLVIDLKENNDSNGLFKYMIIKQCNKLHALLPFLFEKVEDYTEILFPDNLLKDGSFLRAMVNTENIPEEDWRDVEIIGWLYQYYISEKKDQVFADLKKNIKISKENIPAATQLFTPHWIVRYLVENSLGRLWMLNHPDSRLIEKMDYYIKPEQVETDFLKVSTPEEIKVCDPACGSGHMLVYAFDLLYYIYEEAGYQASDIPGKILKNNLYGIEIDRRAGELAAFALTMKARSKYNRFFRKPVQPNICVLQNIYFDKDELENYMDEVGHDLFSTNLVPVMHLFEEADNFGSLIRPPQINVEDALQILEGKDLSSNLFLNPTHQKVLLALKQADYLSQKYHVVVANPPYMGGKGMNGRLKVFLEEQYQDVKSDLFSAFIIRNTELALPGGQLGYMSPFVWMFISSYEKLRIFLLDNKTITSLIQLEYSGFDGATVPICTFTIENAIRPNFAGGYIRLSEFRGADNQGPKALEAINNSDCGWFYRVLPNDFKKVPGSPIAYWTSTRIKDIFREALTLGQVAAVRHGLSTGKNDEVVRLWFEVSVEDFGKDFTNREDALISGFKWFPYNKGGDFRKWYGNFEYVLRYDEFGQNKMSSFSGHRHDGKSHYFMEGVTWTFVSSSKFAARYTPTGFVFDVGGSTLFADHPKILLALLCTKMCFEFLRALNPTLNFQVGNIKSLPILDSIFGEYEKKIYRLGERAIELSRMDWNSYETSWDFTKPLLLSSDFQYPKLKDAYISINDHNRQIILEMQEIEKENNRTFLEAYGLQDEISPEVPLHQITLTCNPYYRYGPDKSEEELESLLLIDTIKEYISYAVGCMFGRYSLDKEGLIYAGGEFDPSQYQTFPADQDNVIPVLAEDYFKDDIVTRFVEFVQVTFTAETLEENLDFIADTLGRKKNETARDTIRRYFVNDFYKDHVQMYKKRPIYWMFTSGKEKAFNCLIYLHRYQPDTVATVRTGYLHRLQDALEVEKKHLQRIIEEEAGKTAARNAAKALTKLEKQIAELKKYDEVVHHYADKRIELDLDDGVKVNYAKLGELLAKL